MEANGKATSRSRASRVRDLRFWEAAAHVTQPFLKGAPHVLKPGSPANTGFPMGRLRSHHARVTADSFRVVPVVPSGWVQAAIFFADGGGLKRGRRPQPRTAQKFGCLRGAAPCPPVAPSGTASSPPGFSAREQGTVLARRGVSWPGRLQAKCRGRREL